MSNILPLADVLATRSIDGLEVRYRITEDWGQGRATFGGLLSALAADAMRAVAGAAWGPDVKLTALQTSFVGPVAVGEAVLQVRVLREGKNVRQVQATLVQWDADKGEQVGAVFLGVYGARRESSLQVMLPTRPEPARPVEALADMPYLAGLTPNFTQHFQFRWAAGSLPFTGGKDWNSSVHLKLRDALAGHPHREELLCAMLADAGPTPALGRMTVIKPASSVSWALELRVPEATDPDGWWRYDKETIAAAHGYVNERTWLWAPDGSLAGLGYQVVGVYG